MATAKKYDVIIIGSGITGSLVALKLAKQKFKVLILEAGDTRTDRNKFLDNFSTLAQKDKIPNLPYTKGADANNKFAPSSDVADFSLYDPAKKQFFVQTGPDPFKSQYLRIAGGTTWSWRGNCPRFLPSDFKMKTKFGVADDWPISYDDLEKYYCDAEDEIGISGNDKEWDEEVNGKKSRPYPMKQIIQAYSDQLIKKILEGKVVEGKKVKVIATPQARLSQQIKSKYGERRACEGNHNCIPVCPSGAKYEAYYTLKKAIQAGAEVIDKAVVTKLETDKNGKLISRVIYKQWEISGDSKKVEEKTAEASIVVLAANAIETPKLLLMSKIANSSDQVGRNLMDHLGGEGACILPFKIYPFRGPQSTSAIDVYRDGDFRKEKCGFRLTVGNDGWGRGKHPFDVLESLLQNKFPKLFGEELNHELEDIITRQFRFSYSTDMLPHPENRITLSGYKDDLGVPKPQIKMKVDEYSKKGIAFAQTIIKKLFKLLKAPQHSWEMTPKDAYSGSGHIMGTCRMGNDPKTSVVDKDCRTHDHKNLFIADASVFTTGSTANPTITIGAIALYAADKIKQQLEK
ncbi:MAG: GMC family oxidoreductase [Bacteroidota bacterium]